jgi:3-isopropylmalate/(R)-2-methylmalate dehydratase large subunit
MTLPISQTLVEKILARCAGLASTCAGDEVYAKPDFVHAYELKGTTDVIQRDMADFGDGRVKKSARFVIFIDHRVPSKTPDQELLHEQTRAWAKEQGMTLFERHGIGHQVAVEQGYAVPGSFSVHADGHVAQIGAFGALGLGLRGNVFEAFVSEGVTIRVPATTRVLLTGRLGLGVMGRDVFHHLLYRFGSECAAFEVLEFGGVGVDGLSIEARQTICGLAMFTGALTALFDPTPAILSRLPASPRLSIAPLNADTDANYSKTLHIALEDVEPMIVLPPSPANARPLADHLGIPIQAGYLGSCASGRIEDLQIAARILGGRKIDQSFALHVVPTSNRIMSAAAKDGALAALIDAGAFVSSPSCDFCSGNIATMSSGQRAVSTGTLNVPGRMGHVDSEIYLGSSAMVAASALEGRTADPRPYLKER